MRESLTLPKLIPTSTIVQYVVCFWKFVLKKKKEKKEKKSNKMLNKTILNHFCLRKAHIKGSIATEMFRRQQIIMGVFVQAQ